MNKTLVILTAISVVLTIAVNWEKLRNKKCSCNNELG